MKRFSCLLMCFIFINSVAVSAEELDEKAEIRKAIEEYYFKGQMESDKELLRKIFHKSGHLHAIGNDGKIWTMSAEDWIERKDPAKKGGYVDNRIVRIDVDGNAASVTVRMFTKNWAITDYYNMLKIDGKWMIVSKIFQSTKR